MAARAAGNAAENAYTAGRCNVWAARCNQGTDPPSVRGEHLVAFAVSFRDAADAQWLGGGGERLLRHPAVGGFAVRTVCTLLGRCLMLCFS
jgi:hypothetical protein